MFAGHRFGVELQAPAWKVAVFQAHDDVVLGPGGGPQGCGEGFVDGQGVVAYGGEVLG